MDQNEAPELSTIELCRLLQELEANEFKAFKMLLREYSMNDAEPKISRGLLENANYLDTADLMIRHYGKAEAFEMAALLLPKIPRLDLVERVQKSLLSNHELLKRRVHDKKMKYMEFIVEKFGVMEENACLIGEFISLKERYTKLLIIKNHRVQEEREHEIMSTGRKHLNIMAQRAAYSNSCIADLFEPDEWRNAPRIVVLQGAAGIGKTMTARKIMLDWASGELFQGKFNYVFYINCREVNEFLKEPTIADLLLHSCPELSLDDIETEPEKLLFVIDGFDELKLPTDLALESPRKKSLKDSSILDLISKTFLIPSSILITTRPTALEKLKRWLIAPRFAEILGFSEEDRKEYFIKFFGDDIRGILVYNTVKENETLFTMCFVPIVCWIVCTVLTEPLTMNGDFVPALKSTTSLYMSFLANLLNYQSSDAAQLKINKHLKQLCTMAKGGIFTQNILFEQSDLVNHGLDFPDIQSLFLKNDMFRKDAQCQTFYSFIHLSFQEFFAALFYILRENEDSAGYTVDTQQNVMSLLEGYRTEGQNHLMLTVRFLFGLLNPDILRKMQKSLKWNISVDFKIALQKWINKKIGKAIRDKDMLHCLYEIQEEMFVKEAVQGLEVVDLEYSQSHMDVKILAFCMKNAPALQAFHLKNYDLKPEDITMLGPCLNKCSSLKLESCGLTASYCARIVSVLKINSSLKVLDLSRNKLQDFGLKELCEMLKQPSCKINIFMVKFCCLTDSCCADLASVVQTNTSLEGLDLSVNRLGDSGIKQLCEGLKSCTCNLRWLILRDTGLTNSCVEELCSVLREIKTLTHLHLMKNQFNEQSCAAFREFKHIQIFLDPLQSLRNPNSAVVWVSNWFSAWINIHATCIAETGRVPARYQAFSNSSLVATPSRDTTCDDLDLDLDLNLHQLFEIAQRSRPQRNGEGPILQEPRFHEARMGESLFSRLYTNILFLLLRIIFGLFRQNN